MILRTEEEAVPFEGFDTGGSRDAEIQEVKEKLPEEGGVAVKIEETEVKVEEPTERAQSMQLNEEETVKGDKLDE